MSGRSTNFYFNMKPSMLHPEGGFLIGVLDPGGARGVSVDLIGDWRWRGAACGLGGGHEP